MQNRRFIESLPHLLWTSRGDGTCDYLSPQWGAYTGIPEQEHLGYGWLDCLHPDDRPPTFEAWQAAVRSRQSLNVQFRIRRYDGVYRWFQTQADPELDAEGNVVRWYGSNTDVQALWDARRDLEALNRDLERLVEARTAELRHALDEREAAQQSSKTGSWTFDLSTGAVRWSAQLFRTLQLPVADEAPPFDTHHRLFTPESWARLEPAVAAAAAHGTPYELELELAVQPGQGRRWAVARCSVERDERGKVVRLRGTFADVTEMMQVRLALRQALERLGLATAASGIGVWDWDVQQDILVWDPQMYALYGLAEGTPLTGVSTWGDVVAPEDQAAAAAALEQALAGERPFDHTFHVDHPQRGRRALRGLASVIRADDGTPIRMTGVNLDVTAEEEAAERGARERRLFQEFVEQAPAAIALFDRERKILAVSALYATQFYGSGRETPWQTGVDAALCGDTAVGEAEEFLMPDGEVHSVDWEARPWLGGDGEIWGATLFVRDVTERRRLMAREEQQRLALERSNTDLERFAYAASHDLQEPLRAVSGFATLLEARFAPALGAEGQVLIAHIVEGAARMSGLINDLLAYSRLGRAELATTTLRLDEAVHAALQNLTATVRERSPRIEIGELPTVRGDRTQLVMLFQNLIGNAIKYSGPRRPEIHITAAPDEQGWRVAIADNGIGIPVDARERVFGMFQRLHTRDEYAGSGIGLALCRRIVERHGGQIWVAPTDGPGTTLLFTLPAQ